MTRQRDGVTVVGVRKHLWGRATFVMTRTTDQSGRLCTPCQPLRLHHGETRQQQSQLIVCYVSISLTLSLRSVLERLPVYIPASVYISLSRTRVVSSPFSLSRTDRERERRIRGDVCVCVRERERKRGNNMLVINLNRGTLKSHQCGPGACNMCRPRSGVCTSARDVV